MTRPSFDHTLDVRQQYLSLVFQKIPGEADWTLINQGRVFTPEQSADTNEYSRIGDQNTLQVPGQVTTNINFEIYVEDDIAELARVLGHVKPITGWTGSEVIRLDPTFVADYKIENYDGVGSGAQLLFTEYINEFRPANLSPPLEAEGDARIATVSGVAASYYIIPEAGVGAS